MSLHVQLFFRLIGGGGLASALWSVLLSNFILAGFLLVSLQVDGTLPSGSNHRRLGCKSYRTGPAEDSEERSGKYFH